MRVVDYPTFVDTGEDSDEAAERDDQRIFLQQQVRTVIGIKVSSVILNQLVIQLIMRLTPCKDSVRYLVRVSVPGAESWYIHFSYNEIRELRQSLVTIKHKSCGAACQRFSKAVKIAPFPSRFNGAALFHRSKDEKKRTELMHKFLSQMMTALFATHVEEQYPQKFAGCAALDGVLGFLRARNACRGDLETRLLNSSQVVEPADHLTNYLKRLNGVKTLRTAHNLSLQMIGTRRGLNGAISSSSTLAISAATILTNHPASKVLTLYPQHNKRGNTNKRRRNSIDAAGEADVEEMSRRQRHSRLSLQDFERGAMFENEDGAASDNELCAAARRAALNDDEDEEVESKPNCRVAARLQLCAAGYRSSIC